jgi:acetolactate synthase small subunit
MEPDVKKELEWLKKQLKDQELHQKGVLDDYEKQLKKHKNVLDVLYRDNRLLQKQLKTAKVSIDSLKREVNNIKASFRNLR